MEMIVYAARSIFRTDWIAAILSDWLKNLIGVFSTVKRIALIAAFPLACLGVITAFVWIGFGDYFSPEFPLVSGSRSSSCAGVSAETSSSQSDDNFWEMLSSFFQFSNYLDGVWPQANQFERADAKAEVQFTPPFLGWLERDRNKFQQVGNTLFYSDGNRKITVFQ
ncbi:MAG: hypothetical protein PHE24_04695 [Patescibacteria group bacterium]|nr:hypothetical protein [Patescibacteria group bacterium]